MKFSEKYTDVAVNTYIIDDNFYYENTDNCYICGALTNFVEKYSGAHICSDECEEEFLRQLMSNRVDNPKSYM